MIATLAGGVGGARFLDGLVQANGAENVSAVVNTADDFDLYGLRICPDLDTVLYTLAGLANPVTGWGIAGDTRATLDGIAAYGEEPWFLLGDRDFATHILRTAWLRERRIALTEVTDSLRRRLGGADAGHADDRRPVGDHDRDARTGWLEFQDYFVRRRQQDDVIGVSVRRHRGRPTGTRCARCDPACRDDRARAVEPDRQHRPDPGHRRISRQR